MDDDKYHYIFSKTMKKYLESCGNKLVREDPDGMFVFNDTVKLREDISKFAKRKEKR